MLIGLLALQGGFAAHQRVLERLNTRCMLIKKPQQLDLIDGLILPGGESTTLLKLMDQNFKQSLTEFCLKRAVLATCAGTILLAKTVTPQQPCLGVLDVTVERNGYGRQLDSFTAMGRNLDHELFSHSLPLVFIRAPKIIALGTAVKPLIEYQNETVLIQQKNILAATFHPELTDDLTIHEHFMKLTEIFP